MVFLFRKLTGIEPSPSALILDRSISPSFILSAVTAFADNLLEFIDPSLMDSRLLTPYSKSDPTPRPVDINCWVVHFCTEDPSEIGTRLSRVTVPSSI